MASRDVFRLSTRLIDFGRIAEGATEWRSLSIVGGTGGYEIAASEPWISAMLGSSTRDGRELTLSVAAADLPGAGTHRGTVEVRCAAETAICTVVACYGTSVKCKRRVPDRRQPPSPAPEKPAERRERAGESDAATSLPPVESVLSLVLGLSAIGCLFALFYWLAHAMLQERAADGSLKPLDPQDPTLLVTWLAFCAAYLLFAFRRLLLPAGRQPDLDSAVGVEEEVLRACQVVCGRLRIRRPGVRIVERLLPNVRSFGISPSLGSLQVSHELVIATLESGGPAALQAALAHELAHLRLFDTFFFTAIGPPLAVTKGLLGFFVRMRAAVGQGAGGFSASPLIMFGLLGPRNPLGCLTAVFLMVVLIGCLGVMLFYVGWLVVALMTILALCLAYSRFVERRADLRAVESLGSTRGMLDALGAVLPGFPGEMARVHRFANMHLPNVQQYTIEDLMHCLAAGGNPNAGISVSERLFRSHPSFMSRLAYLAAAASSLNGGTN